MHCWKDSVQSLITPFWEYNLTMPNPNPPTQQLGPYQFRKKDPNTRLTIAARVRLPLELADHYDTLTLEQRSQLVVFALEHVHRP